MIVRSGLVYGPHDPAISRLLVMVRTMPAVPVIEDGAQRFQPIWYEDMGEALARALEDPSLARQTLEVAGPEQTTPNDLLRRLTELCGRRPAIVRVPSRVAELGVKAAAVVGASPLPEAQLTMLEEENIIRAGHHNALTNTLGVRGTPLDAGLRKLMEQLPEVLPSEGVGPMESKRFWADIRGWRTAAQLKQEFRRRFAEVLPLDVSSEVRPLPPLKKGSTFTVALPGRGSLPMRVLDVTPRRSRP